MMKKRFFFFAILFSALAKTNTAQLYQGRFINIFTGGAYSTCSALQNDLQAPDLLGSKLKINGGTGLYGVSGYSLQFDGVMLGGSYYAYQQTSQEVNGEVTLGNNAGFFNIGYSLLNKNGWLGFPYIGIGWHKAQFEITNTTSDRTLLIGNNQIVPKQTATFTKTGSAFEAGYSLKYFLADVKDSGSKVVASTIGIDTGVSFFPVNENWKGTEEVSSMRKPFLMVIYFRVSSGLGVFRQLLNK